jgi:hypothetical protein
MLLLNMTQRAAADVAFGILHGTLLSLDYQGAIFVACSGVSMCV